MKAEAIVREIATDRVRGATALAGRALDALALSPKAVPALLRVRPGMPLVAAVVRLAQKRGVTSARRELRLSVTRILRASKAILPRGARYLVYGGSGTVEAVLHQARAAIVKDLPADVALVGADALYPNGDFVNAKGTADFLRRARRAGAGVFAVASELKRVRKEIPLERGFERVPGRLVHAILTERGLAYPPMGTLAGVDPSWLDRGALDPHESSGRCHPHHSR